MQETAETLGIGISKLRLMMDSGELPAKKLGKLTMFARKDVLDFVANLPSYVPNKD